MLDTCAYQCRSNTCRFPPARRTRFGCNGNSRPRLPRRWCCPTLERGTEGETERERNREREEQRESEERERARERNTRERERERGTRERGTAAREQAKTIGETSNISAFDPSITQVYPKYHPSIPPSTPHMHIPRPPCTTSASDAVSVASQKAQVLQKKEKKRRASEPPSISLCHFHRTHFLANITSKGEGKQPLKTTTILTKTPHLEFQQPRL